MAELVNLGVDPEIRENKRLMVCDCSCTHFKFVVYPRFPDRVYLECVQCEQPYLAEHETELMKGKILSD